MDIGGTFTDFVIWRDDVEGKAIKSFKVPSTPPHFAEGFRHGFERLLDEGLVKPNDAVVVMHGTTVSTNAVIERSQPAVSLFVTQGFKDILELQRLRLADPINLWGGRKLPLIERDFVFEINERIGSDGTVIQSVDSESVVEAILQAQAKGVNGIAVALINSYKNPANEEEIRKLILKIDPSIDVCTSSEVWPRIGEYERAVNALLNVYVRPKMSTYLEQVETYLTSRIKNVQLFITQSNGGAMATDEARLFPVHTLLSGPASGVTAAQLIARAKPEYQYLTMDMGGTSTDICLIRDGMPTVAENAEVGDFPLTMPVTGIEAIGAGGGSIARLDGSVLRVGPTSAGAYPGPPCFDRGGDKPTVTDAYLMCGYLDPNTFLGGDMKLNPEAAKAAYRPLAHLMSIDVIQAADACIAVATSNMVASVLPYLAQHGVDPEDVSLITFGGNGALHGPLLAAEIGIKRIVVPSSPSVFCAFGGVVTELVHDTVAIVQGTSMTDSRLQNKIQHLEDEARAWLIRQTPEGNIASINMEYWAYMRYRGQSFQIPVDLKLSSPAHAVVNDAAEIFHAEHLRLHAHSDPHAQIEFTELRVRIRGALQAPATQTIAESASNQTPIAESHRNLQINGMVHTASPVYKRTAIDIGASVNGPCIIAQSDATILVPPGYVAQAQPQGELILTREG